MFETDDRLESRELKVEFFCPDSPNRPFDIVVPELLVPVMEGFWGEDCGWIR